MEIIVLRFNEKFAPEKGTIKSHQEIIDKLGYVWFGKRGSIVSEEFKNKIFINPNPKLLLVKSGSKDKFWGYISEIKNETPNTKEIPEYYRENANEFKAWFKITKFEKIEEDIVDRYVTSRSKKPLSYMLTRTSCISFLVEEI